MLPHPELQRMLGEERRAELRRTGREVRIRASRDRRRPGVRQAIGRSLIRAGTRLAGEPAHDPARSR